MAQIKTVEALREIYNLPKGRSVDKVIRRFEQHSRRFIALSPFVILGSTRKGGLVDVTPRGEAPGFVKVIDDETLAIPDRPGNNRLDTLTNILQRPGVGLNFLVPGVNETLRVNGEAQIHDDDELCELFRVEGRLPATVLVIKVKEIYLHCAKALMRSNLWDEAAIIERSQLPAMGQMISDQISSDAAIESEEDMIVRYTKQLY